MCGGGNKGPSSADLIAQENASRAKAQAETDRINAERAAAKELETAKVLKDQTSTAQADAAKRSRNRTLLAGLAAELGQTAPGVAPLEGANAVVVAPAPQTAVAIPGMIDTSASLEAPGTQSARKTRQAKSLIGAY